MNIILKKALKLGKRIPAVIPFLPVFFVGAQFQNKYFFNMEADSTKPKFGFSFKTQNQDIYLTPQDEHKYTVIWMHGLGDTAYGHLDLFYSKNSLVPKNTKVIILTAPTMPVTINMGMSMPCWYDILSSDNVQKKVNYADVDKSYHRIYKVMKKEAELLGDAKKLFIGGFSQGASLALYSGLNYEEKVGGILSLSGVLFDHFDLDETKKDIPIFIYHGMADDMININLAKKSYERMIERGFNVRFTQEEYLGHFISPEELKKIKEFFSSILI